MFKKGWVLGLWRKKQQSEDDFMKSGADDCGEINRPALYNSFPKSSAAPLQEPVSRGCGALGDGGVAQTFEGSNGCFPNRFWKSLVQLLFNF